jgi:hypothetical protein
MTLQFRRISPRAGVKQQLLTSLVSEVCEGRYVTRQSALCAFLVAAVGHGEPLHD